MTGFTGSAVINDFGLTTNGTLDLVGVERDNGWRVLGEIHGLTAGDTIQTALSDGSQPTTYTVNATGTSITRDDTGRVVWSGTADELSALNFIDIDYQEYYGGILSDRIGQYLQQYVSLVDGTMTIDLETLQQNLSDRLAAVQERVASHDQVTADVIYDEVIAELNDITGIDLEEYLSITILERLRSRVESDFADGNSVLSSVLDNLDPDGVMNFLRTQMSRFVEAIGTQAMSAGIPDVIYNDDSAIENLGLDPVLNQIFATRSARRMVHNIIADYRARLSNDGPLDKIVLNGAASTVNAGIIYGASNVIDASTVDSDYNLIIANFGGAGDSIIGSNARDVILADNGDTITGGAGNDFIVFADGGFAVESATVDAAISLSVSSSEFYDEHTRQTVELSSITSATVVGFETGFEIDNGATDAINVDNPLMLRFDFDDDGLTVKDGNGSLFLAVDDAAVLSTVRADIVSDSRTPRSTVSADLLINDRKVTAINAAQTIAADPNVDHYFIPEGAVLTNVTGTVDIDDCRFSTSGNLTVTGGTTANADGTGYYFAATAYGLSAGDTVSIGDLWSDPGAARVYRVSDDGTQIIRDADGTVVYEGDASTLASMNIGPITFADYYGDQIATGVQTFIDKYITFDGNNLVINADGLQADIKAGIEGHRAELEGADVDIAVQYLSNVFADILNINVSLENLLSGAALDRLKDRIDAAIEGGTDAADALIADIDAYQSGSGLMAWVGDKILTPLDDALGTEGFARDLTSIVDADGTLHLSRWIETARPLLSDQFSNEYTSKVLAVNLDAIGNDILTKLRADGAGDGVANLIFDGDTVAGIGLFLTPLDSINAEEFVIDASASTLENNIIIAVGNASALGSTLNNIFAAADNTTVNTSNGNSYVSFTDDDRQVLELHSIGAARVYGFDPAVDVISLPDALPSDLKFEVT